MVIKSEYVNHLLTVTTAKLCDHAGFETIQEAPLAILNELQSLIIFKISQRARQFAEHSCRNEPNLDDIALTFDEIGIKMHDLMDYVKFSETPQFDLDVPRFPAKRPLIDEPESSKDDRPVNRKDVENDIENVEGEARVYKSGKRRLAKTIGILPEEAGHSQYKMMSCVYNEETGDLDMIGTGTVSGVIPPPPPINHSQRAISTASIAHSPLVAESSQPVSALKKKVNLSWVCTTSTASFFSAMPQKSHAMTTEKEERENFAADDNLQYAHQRDDCASDENRCILSDEEIDNRPDISDSEPTSPVSDHTINRANSNVTDSKTGANHSQSLSSFFSMLEEDLLLSSSDDEVDNQDQPGMIHSKSSVSDVAIDHVNQSLVTLETADPSLVTLETAHPGLVTLETAVPSLLTLETAHLGSMFVALETADSGLVTLETAVPSLVTLETAHPDLVTLETADSSLVTIETAHPDLVTLETADSSLVRLETAVPSLVTLETAHPDLVTLETAVPILVTLETVHPDLVTLKTADSSLVRLETAADESSLPSPKIVVEHCKSSIFDDANLSASSKKATGSDGGQTRTNHGEFSPSTFDDNQLDTFCNDDSPPFSYGDMDWADPSVISLKTADESRLLLMKKEEEDVVESDVVESVVMESVSKKHKKKKKKHSHGDRKDKEKVYIEKKARQNMAKENNLSDIKIKKKREQKMKSSEKVELGTGGILNEEPKKLMEIKVENNVERKTAIENVLSDTKTGKHRERELLTEIRDRYLEKARRKNCSSEKKKSSKHTENEQSGSIPPQSFLMLTVKFNTPSADRDSMKIPFAAPTPLPMKHSSTSSKKLSQIVSVEAPSKASVEKASVGEVPPMASVMKVPGTAFVKKDASHLPSKIKLESMQAVVQSGSRSASTTASAPTSASRSSSISISATSSRSGTTSVSASVSRCSSNFSSTAVSASTTVSRSSSISIPVSGSRSSSTSVSASSSSSRSSSTSVSASASASRSKSRPTSASATTSTSVSTSYPASTSSSSSRSASTFALTYSSSSCSASTSASACTSASASRSSSISNKKRKRSQEDRHSDRSSSVTSRVGSSHKKTTLEVETVYKIEGENGETIWFCPTCLQQGDDGRPMIGCDECYNWFHWHCLGITAEPKEEQWFCEKCKSIKGKLTGSAGRSTKKKSSGRSTNKGKW